MATTETPPTGLAQPASPTILNAHYGEPHLLVQLQDDLSQSRLREAFWISVAVHLLVIIGLANSDRFVHKRAVPVITAADLLKQKDSTFLELPPDEQKLTRRPQTNVLSDKDRIASSRNPSIDKRTLDQLRGAQQPGPPAPPIASQKPGPVAPPQQQPAHQQSPPQQSQEVAKGQAPPLPQQTPSNTNPALTLPRSGNTPNPGAFSTGSSPGEAIAEAARAAAASRGGGGAGGDYGLAPNAARGGAQSQLDILSDTQGVDFGPYLARVLATVRQNWYNLIPEIARPPLMKKGKVSVEFAITKNGTIAGMRLAGQSGDVALDRAAWGGITASNPFPPLPAEFNGQYLALRFHFYYNPGKGDIE